MLPFTRATRAYLRKLTSRCLRSTQSPYNAGNPYYGYPAYLPNPPSSEHPSYAPIPQPHHQRRRKRDLVRTLTYLAALRFLKLHRELRRRLTQFVASVWRVLTLRFLWDRRPSASSAEQKKVHWATNVNGGKAMDEGGWLRQRWRSYLAWLVVAVLVLARLPRTRARLLDLSRDGGRLAVEVVVGRPDGRRARAMVQGAVLARWAGTKLVR